MANCLREAGEHAHVIIEGGNKETRPVNADHTGCMRLRLLISSRFLENPQPAARPRRADLAVEASPPASSPLTGGAANV
jgi:hypothetical protein